MTAPPWGHKPAAVTDQDDYWGKRPPAPSARMVYWARRLREGSWKPNRRILDECSQCRAGLLGIWNWEAMYAFGPLEEMLRRSPERPLDEILVYHAGQALRYHYVESMAEFQDYWRVLAELSDPARVVSAPA